MNRQQAIEQALMKCNSLDMGDCVEIPLAQWEAVEEALALPPDDAVVVGYCNLKDVREHHKKLQSAVLWGKQYPECDTVLYANLPKAEPPNPADIQARQDNALQDFAAGYEDRKRRAELVRRIGYLLAPPACYEVPPMWRDAMNDLRDYLEPS